MRALGDRAARDPEFMAVAALFAGDAGVDPVALVTDLVARESVPFLPVLRYKESGLRKRKDWEDTWDKQRDEDAIDDEVRKARARDADESEAAFEARVAAEQRRRKEAEVGRIPRPPKYASADFAAGEYWTLRGALDVPKERWVSYPHCSREGDPSLLVGWAGWTHLQQAEALAAWYHDLVEREAWPAERLAPVLAGLLELVPWLKQWHNAVDPVYGQRLGDFYEQFLDAELQQHKLTRDALRAWTPPAAVRRGRAPARARA